MVKYWDKYTKMHGQQNVRISLFVVYSGPVYSNKWYVFVQKLDKLIYKNVIRLHNSAMSRQVFYEAKQNYGWFCIFFFDDYLHADGRTRQNK